MADEPAPLATIVNLQGSIKAASQSVAGPFRIGPPFVYLQGSIGAAARVQTAILTVGLPILTRVNVQGVIGARTTARADVLRPVQLPVLLYGNINASGTTQLNEALQYATVLSGSISSRSSLRGIARPWQPLLVGRITAATRAFFGIAELQEPLPPYPPPFPTFSTLDYLDKVTSEHNQRPRYMATVGMSVDPMIEDQQLVAGFAGLFDLDYCVGEQEDFTGQWIGKSRWIELPALFFSWDVQGLGWNQANWKGPSDASNRIERLDDYHYRLLLYAQIIANHWDGSIPAAYAAWDTLFRYEGIKVIIQDYGNMTMLYGLLSTSAPDAILLSLFTTGQMDLRPEGVALRAYALQPQPNVAFFAWDSASDSVHGWDTGYWGIMQPPGQGGYAPAGLTEIEGDSR